VVVLNADSSYNASLQAAVERLWNFTGFEFAYDTGLKKFSKGDYTFLLFSKSKGSKVKCKFVGSSEEDLNGLVISRKSRRRIMKDDVLAYAFCSNFIDTNDWEAEMIRGV